MLINSFFLGLFICKVIATWNQIQDIKINLKYHDSDYFIQKIGDDQIYYLENSNYGYPNVQQCKINEPEVTVSQVLTIQDQRKFNFMGRNQLGYLDGNTLNLFKIKEEENSIKFVLLALVDLERILKPTKNQFGLNLDEENFQFTTLENYFYLVQGKSLKILSFSDNLFNVEKNVNLEFKLSLLNYKIVYKLPNKLFILDNALKSIKVYTINDSNQIIEDEIIDNILDLISGQNNTVFVVRENEVIHYSANQNQTLHLKAKINLAALKSDGKLILYLVDDGKYSLEIVEFREKLYSNELVKIRADLTRIIATSNYLILIYKNILTIYPFVTEERIFDDYMIEMVHWEKFELVIPGLKVDFLVLNDNSKFIYYEIKRAESYIECKKDVNSPSEDFNIKVSFLSTNCQISGDHQFNRFANNSCGYHQTIAVQYRYKLDYFFIGTVILCALITASLWAKCILRRNLSQSNHTNNSFSPKKDYPKIKKIQPSEIQNFIYEDEPVSEEMRVIPKAQSSSKKKNPNIVISNSSNPQLPHTFDTPRFNFGIDIKHEISPTIPLQKEMMIEELVTDENRFTKRNEDSFGEEIRSQGQF